MSIGHGGLGDHYRQLRFIAVRGDSIFHAKAPIEAASGLLALGTGTFFFSF